MTNRSDKAVNATVKALVAHLLGVTEEEKKRFSSVLFAHLTVRLSHNADFAIKRAKTPNFLSKVIQESGLTLDVIPTSMIVNVSRLSVLAQWDARQDIEIIYERKGK